MKRPRENQDNTENSNKRRRDPIFDIVDVFNNNPEPKDINWLVNVMPNQIDMPTCDLLLYKMSLYVNGLYKKRPENQG